MDIGITVCLMSLIILTVVMMSGVPIPFAFLSAIIFLVAIRGYDTSFLLPAGFAKLNSTILLALPFFVALGYIVSKGSIATRLINLINALVGRVTGGLGIASVVTSATFGAVSGAASSSVIAIGKIMIPSMEKYGYPRGYSTALISSAAVLSTLIPPSLAMIMFAYVTRQSVAACFLATVGPGLVLTVLFSIVNVFMVRKIPTIVRPPKLNRRETLSTLYKNSKAALGALALPVIILGGIYGGIMTPTEAAAVSVVYSFFLSMFIYRDLRLSEALLALRACCAVSGTMMLITFFALILSRLFIMEQMPQQIAALVLSVTTNKILILFVVNIFLIFIGMIMTEGSAVVLIPPILLPTMIQIGVHPIHFAAIIGVNLGMGMMTPPVAVVMYIGARIGNVTIDQMIKPALILILFASIPVILITTYWPELSLFLPRIAGFL